MDFTLEEVESILEEMGFKNIPHSQLEDFSKDLKRLIRHDIRAEKKYRMSTNNGGPAATTSLFKDPTATHLSPKKDDRESRSNNLEEKNMEVEKHLKKSIKSTKQKELLWKKLKSDPVRLHSWYKTFWDIHGLK